MGGVRVAWKAVAGSRSGRALPLTVALAAATGAAAVPTWPASATPAATTAMASAPMVSPSGAWLPEETTQVVEVSAAKWHSTRATATAWQYADGAWQQVLSAPARVGKRGLAPEALRRQSTNKTPAGVFDLGLGFGVNPAPAGTALQYRVVTKADYWVYDPRDPSTYNKWVVGRKRAQWRKSWAEHLIDYRVQYSHAIVIDYNHAGSAGSPDTRAGGGIFLHASGPAATAGCVSVSDAVMTQLLTWLQPSALPQIVISVHGRCSATGSEPSCTRAD